MKRILVVDDEMEVIQIVRSILKTKGYEIQSATRGEEGLRLAAANPPDLIVSDLMMPKMSGMEFVKRLRADERLKSIPVIILSAVGADSDKPEDYWVRGLGVDEFLAKPFDPMDLLGRVEYIFRRDTYVSSRESVRIPREFLSQESAGAPASDDPRPAPAVGEPPDLDGKSPSDVVRIFVEAWNSQDWAAEYHCMTSDLMGALPLDDYAARRQEAYDHEPNAPVTRTVRRIISERISGVVAKVIVEREDRASNGSRVRTATFTLREDHRVWKVVKYTDDPEPVRRSGV